ncbi:unnamed protein product [Mytilus coruscus]|uniref:Sema domain-containing protein n=1 Tax=Mytilus coruscus TaxID=42192 RepID=A0A6J8C896_MYTCO|nr:unnamed protein product [Mytilus coruscus]
MGFIRKLSFSLVLFIIAIAVESTLSQTSTENKISTLRQMIVSNETIYVGGVGGIVSLHRENMTEKAFEINNSNVWLLLYDEKREEIIQCNENYDNVSHCSKLSASLQSTGIESTNISVDIRYLPTCNMIYVKEVNTSIVVIGSNSAKVLNTSYGILSFNLANFTLFKTESNQRGPMNIERADKKNLTLAFKTSFYHAPHVYFFFQVHLHKQFDSSRIGKLCLNYEKKYNRTGYYHSYEDMSMTCTHNGFTFTEIGYALDDGESAIVVFFHNNRSVICAYSWDNIKTGFLESRKSKLLCGNTTVDGEYFEFTPLQNSHEYCFDNEGDSSVCNKAIIICDELTGKFCGTQYHNTLVGGKGIENKMPYYVLNKTITALDIFRTDNYSVLYFGTIDGDLGRVGLQLDWEPEKLNTSFVSNATSKIIHVKVEREAVYFLTEKRIHKYDFKNCSIHKNCESCMDSFNPFCGWDYAKNRCDIDYQNSLVWIPSVVGVCIHITKITDCTRNDAQMEGQPSDILLFQVEEKMECQTIFDISHFLSDEIDDITLSQICENMENEQEELENNTSIQFDTIPFIPKGEITCKINGTIGKVNTTATSLCNIEIGNLQTGNYTFEILYKEEVMATTLIEINRTKSFDFETCKDFSEQQQCDSNRMHFPFNDLESYSFHISPLSGPVKGGTFITVFANNSYDEGDDIVLFIEEANCSNIEVLEKNSSFRCKTGEVPKENNGKINISFDDCQTIIANNTYYTYKNSSINGFSPRKGITTGNTTVTITGQDIEFKGTNRYNISLCDNASCIECSKLENLVFNDSVIMCKTGNSTDPTNLTELVVIIDTLTVLQLNGTFQYLPDPTFDFSNETLKALESGGAKFTINGNGFNNVGQITVERVVEPCEVPSDNQAVCQTPKKLLNQSNVQTVIVNFDGIARAFEINYVDDPSFERFGGVVDYDKESPITIKGKNILNGAREEDYNIKVGLDGKCLISKIEMEFIICVPPKNVPRTNKSEVNAVHVIVGVARIEVYIGDLQYQEDVKILAIIVGVLAATLVTAVIIVILAVLVLKKKKRKAIKELKMELMTREEMVRKASREEFADAQMTMRSIKSDLFTSKVPFCEYQTYVLRQLFPNQDITVHLEVSDERKVGIETAIDNFKILLSNKLFLKSLVQTFDRPNMLTIQEKAHFSSVLSISLMGNMRLFFDLIDCLMEDVIRSATKKQQKVLFRRFESITLRLMANWLQIGLYGQLTSHCGMQLFMLYKAVKTIVEMAPIDALTSNSKNTIAEEKLLKMRIEHQSFTLQIDLNGNSDQRYPVKVLDCDTISQVKQKCCEQIYKNKPSLKIPHNDELSLEWQEGRAGKLTLNDIDNTSEKNNGLVCLNTLKHYMVKDNSRMTLIYKQHDDQTVNVNPTAFQEESLMSEDITLLMPENVECPEVEGQKWHLSNLTGEESKRDADFGDIFLNRLFLTKLLLSECIDTTFESLIDPQSLSIPIRYFIGMLDKLGKTYRVEPDVLQSWKNECYATRVWAPLIGKPDILFDVSVPAYVEPCMDILRQVFVESFTQTAHKVNKESPPQKLLFHKDIPRYRKLIGPFSSAWNQ